MERRIFNISRFEVRADEENGVGPILSGHAAVFDSPSVEMWGVREFVYPGAFTKTIAEFDQRALNNHDTSMVLGRRSAGTLRLVEDDKGLAVEIDIPPTSYGNDLMISAERGDIKEMSFGFDVIRDEWEHDDNGRAVKRHLREVKLYEVSPVTFPAYPASEFSLRSFEQMQAAAGEAGAEFLEIVNRHAHGTDAPGQEPHPEDRSDDVFDINRAKLWADLMALI